MTAALALVRAIHLGAICLRLERPGHRLDVPAEAAHAHREAEEPQGDGRATRTQHPRRDSAA